MTIYEQILAGLQTKFAGADSATLQRIASKRSEGVTDESTVQAIVDAVTFSDVMTNYGDYRADGAQKTAVANYERKHNIKDGKPIVVEKPNEPTEPVKAPTTTEPTSPAEPEKKEKSADAIDIDALVKDAVRVALESANINSDITALAKRLDDMDAEKAQALRTAQIEAKAKEFGIPAFVYRGKVIDSDADLNKYFADLKQEMTNNGYQFTEQPAQPDTTEKDEADTIADLINRGTEERVKKD